MGEVPVKSFREKFHQLLSEVFSELGLPVEVIPAVEEEIMLRLIYELRVPKTNEALRNFIAAYLRVFHDWSAESADKIASSSRGRVTWERNIMMFLKYRCLRKYLGLE